MYTPVGRASPPPLFYLRVYFAPVLTPPLRQPSVPSSGRPAPPRRRGAVLSAGCLDLRTRYRPVDVISRDVTIHILRCHMQLCQCYVTGERYVSINSQCWHYEEFYFIVIGKVQFEVIENLYGDVTIHGSYSIHQTRYRLVQHVKIALQVNRVMFENGFFYFIFLEFFYRFFKSFKYRTW